MSNPTFMQFLRGLLYTGGFFALICIGLFFLQLRSATKHVDAQVTTTLASVQENLTKVSGDVHDVKEMLNATLFQAEEVMHHADILVATESKAQASQLAHVNAVLTQLQATVTSLDDSQKRIADSVTTAVNTIPGVVVQLQQTLGEVQNTVAKTGQTVEALTKLETDLDPTVQHINATTGHLDSIASSLDKVVLNATKPQPWYKKMIGYLWAPIKIVSIFAK